MSPGQSSLTAYYPRIQAYIESRTPCSSLAADLTQETFLRAHRAITRKGPPEAPYSWLMRIADNVSRSYYSHRFRLEVPAGGVPTCAGDAPEPLENLVHLETAEQVSTELTQALDSLSSLDREAILGYYFEDLSLHELGGKLGCSTGAAKARLHRARKKVKTYLLRSKSGAATDYAERAN